jgi:hypothetical protein
MGNPMGNPMGNHMVHPMGHAMGTFGSNFPTTAYSNAPGTSNYPGPFSGGNFSFPTLGTYAPLMPLSNTLPPFQVHFGLFCVPIFHKFFQNLRFWMSIQSQHSMPKSNQSVRFFFSSQQYHSTCLILNSTDFNCFLSNRSFWGPRHWEWRRPIRCQHHR